MAKEFLTQSFLNLKPRLLEMAARITGNSDDAQDVVQDVFARLWSKKFHSKREADGILTVAVRNKSIDSVRHRNRLHEDLLLEAGNVTDNQPPDIEGSPVNDIYESILDIINKELTDTQREILLLREMKGMAIEDIAARLGIAPVTVRVTLSRVRRRIRDLYCNAKGGSDL